MTDKDIKDLVKEIPELDKAWEKFQSEKSESQRETEVEMYRYRMLRERESRKESLPEPEFTKAKRAEQTSEVTSEVTSEISELDIAAIEYFKEALQTGNDSKMQAFRAGANWQKQQMMTEAVDCMVCKDGIVSLLQYNRAAFANVLEKYKDNDKVKLLIIKED